MEYSGYAVSTLLIVLAGFLLVRSRSSKFPYPPGPKGLPLIGNIRDVPTSQEWITYAKWSKEFDSDVIHLNLAGNHIIIVNTQEAAYELFDKRSAIYSDRPRFPMIMELMGWDWSFSFFKYGPKWRAYRRLFHQYFNTNVVSAYHPQALKATHELLERLLDSPEKFMTHVHLMAASLVLNIAYGIDLQSFDDPYIEIADKTMGALAEAGNPGAFLVDSLPWLKYVPEWVPGAGFQKKAKLWGQYASAVADYPLKIVKEEMAKGINNSSIASQCLETYKARTEEETHETIRAISAVIYVAGSDTTVSILCSFFLAMVLYPDVFKKAQQEIDAVVGYDRLPDFSDQSSLPYICAVAQEALRWNPVAPLGGTPHALSEDDIYKGQFMPKGAVVVGNSWALLHDEKVYPDPETFNPERFLKDGKMNPDVRSAEAAYGFGRRICPGRHLANDSIFITIASVVATFDISKSVGADGKFITPSGEYSSGLLSHPKPFECVVKPRSQQSVALVKDAHATHHH